MRQLGLSAAALLLSAGCVAPLAPPPTVSGPGTATATLVDAGGVARASASAVQSADAIRLQVSAINMAPGAYGAHVHMTGRCDAPGFESAGGHWNPTNHQHGRNNPAGMHKGDLPNLMVGADGRGTLEVSIPYASISGAANRLLDSDGAALVIHSGPDDYRTDPSGNSGARIACGVFR